MRLYDKLSIDVWKIIADSVQRLNIYGFTDREFNENLMVLRELLLDLDIDIDFLSRYPNNINEVGLASLLQGIYSAGVFNDYKKANFYEKIYQLDELGIPNIMFRPIDFPLSVEGISLLKDKKKEIIGIRNCFTDGNFDIGYVDEPLNRWYDIINLENANYILNILVDKENNINQEQSFAVLRNFNGIFPNKETIYDIRYPGLCLYANNLKDDRRHYILKQFFFPINHEDVNYPKKLVRMKDNYHYE